MFHRNKMRSAKAKSPSELNKITTAKDWISDPKRQRLYSQIHDNLALSPEQKSSLGTHCIDTFIEYTQGLPESLYRYYAQNGGIIDHALNRTEAALSLFRQFLITSVDQPLSQIQSLWQYALFTASLLQGLGKLATDYHVELFNPQGEHLQKWNPLIHSLMDQGSHYDYTLSKENFGDAKKRITSLLAKKIVPQEGFQWLSSNMQIFSIWLALLNEDKQGAGALGAILARAEAIAQARYYEDFLSRVHNSGGGKRVSTFIDAPIDTLAHKEIEIGEAFILWMQNKLANGRISLNKAPLVSIPGGFIMGPDAFKLFVREHPEYKNWLAVQKAFLSFGSHETNIEQSLTKDPSMKDSVLFHDYALLFADNVHVHQPKTQDSESISAVEAIYRIEHNILNQDVASPLQLSAEGTWQALSKQESYNPRFGAKPHG